MLNQICFVTDSFNLLDSYLKERTDSPIIFDIRVNEPKLKQLAYSLYKYSRGGDLVCPFSLCFDFKEIDKGNKLDLSRTDLETLAQIVFHSSFLAEYKLPVIFCRGTSGLDAKVEAFKRIVREFLQAQGYEDVLFHPVDSVNFSAGSSVNDPLNIEAISSLVDSYRSLYFIKYLKQGLCGEYLFFSFDSVKNFFTFKRAFEEAEELFKLEEPVFYDVLNQSKLQKKSLEEAKLMYEGCLKELLDNKQYLQIMKTQDEANTINSFYYYEYEILPLWYKQLGHMIKVLMGKRTFKSLFDNNVKKYTV